TLGLAARIAFGTALVEAGLIALALALAVAVGQRALPFLGRADAILAAGARHAELVQRRELMGPELLQSAVASANSWMSISPASASSLTVAMISRRVCSMRDIGTGPERRIRSSKLWAWRRGIAARMASRSGGSAPLSAIAHCSSGTSSSRR